jgi:hypothetical protein
MHYARNTKKRANRAQTEAPWRYLCSSSDSWQHISQPLQRVIAELLAKQEVVDSAEPDAVEA